MADNGKILIGNNSISYDNEILKISNISRTSIVIYENRAYLDALKRYDNDKRIHEQKQNERFRYFGIAALVALFIAAFASTSSNVVGFIFLAVAGVFGFLAYQAKKINLEYKQPRPNRSDYPEKYGLCVNMNSGFSSYFTASNDEGLSALRELQKLINDADENRDTIVYQDNRVNIENKDGVINLGDNNEIKNEFAGVV